MTDLDGLNRDFRDMVFALCDEGAEFLLVGAYAVSFHGHPRTTGDMDLLVRPSKENAARVFRALVRFGAPVAAMGLSEHDLTRPDTVYQIGVPPRRVDILTDITGVSFDRAWQSRVEVDWSGRRVAFLGLDDLIANKQAAGRPQDLLDVAQLEAVRKSKGR
jgi:predicted nucleotidyltransferase